MPRRKYPIQEQREERRPSVHRQPKGYGIRYIAINPYDGKIIKESQQDHKLSLPEIHKLFSSQSLDTIIYEIHGKTGRGKRKIKLSELKDRFEG